MAEDEPTYLEVFGTALIIIIGLLFVGCMITMLGETAWKHDRFYGSDVAVRIRIDKDAEPLWICADTVNSELKNCLSAKEVFDLARRKYQK